MYKRHTTHTHWKSPCRIYRTSFSIMLVCMLCCMMLVLQHCCSTIAHAENKYFNQNDKKFALEKVFPPKFHCQARVSLFGYYSQLPVLQMENNECHTGTHSKRQPCRYYICRRVCVCIFCIVQCIFTRWRMCYEISIKSK